MSYYDPSDRHGWLLYVPIAQSLLFGTQVGIDANGMVQYHFDTKAKRVIESGQGLALVLQNSGAGGLVFTLVMRTLTMIRGT